VTVHHGLAAWFSINGERQDNFDNSVNHVFKKQVGMTIDEFIRMVINAKMRRSERCPKCGGRKISSHKGFPGEYLYICDRCKTCVDSEFDIGGIV
jgi:ssDNA-binding Zn-finger/Zn-ribbon topoisomerase 1